MPFQKGQSGNPGGRPKGTGDLAKAARAHTKEAISTLAKILKDKDASETARISAANSLLDRGYGKPAQALIHQGDEDNPVRMTLADFYANSITTLNGTANAQPEPERLLANGHHANGAPGKEPGS